MEACGKTINQGKFWNVNSYVHVCHLFTTLSFSDLHGTTDGVETGETEMLWVASQWSTQAPLSVSHAAFLYTSCPRPPTLHLHSNAAAAKVLRLLIHYPTQPLWQLKSHRWLIWPSLKACRTENDMWCNKWKKDEGKICVKTAQYWNTVVFRDDDHVSFIFIVFSGKMIMIISTNLESDSNPNICQKNQI